MVLTVDKHVKQALTNVTKSLEQGFDKINSPNDHVAALFEGRKKCMLATLTFLYQQIEKICAYCKIILTTNQAQSNHIKIHQSHHVEDIQLSNQKLIKYYLNNIRDKADLITIEKFKFADMQIEFSKMALLKTVKKSLYSLALLSEDKDCPQLSIALNNLALAYNLSTANIKFDPQTVGISSVICHYRNNKNTQSV